MINAIFLACIFYNVLMDKLRCALGFTGESKPEQGAWKN